MKKIIVSTDFSENSDAACHYAIELAKKTNADIILLHVFEVPVVYSDVNVVTSELDYSIIHDTAEKRLKNYYKKVAHLAGKINIDLLIQEGLASSRISEVALENKADLIIMGTTGMSALERFFGGSNTTRIIGNSPCMVLAIPGNATFTGWSKIVFATDLSEENMDHAKLLVPLAEKFNSEIIFLNIKTDLIDSRKRRPRDIESLLRKHIDYPKISGYTLGDTNITDGIDYFLKHHEADCLVIYTHHRNLLQGIFSRSITKSISFHTTVPLLVLHDSDLKRET